MSRRETDKDLERPHFYSQYWISIAKQYARTGDIASLPAVGALMEDEDEMEDLPPVRPAAKTVTAPPPVPEIDDFPLPVAKAPAKPPKNRPEPKPSALTSFADLAAIGFGGDMEMEEMPVSDEDDTESVISRLGSNFRDDDEDIVEPDEEEAASLESLSEEEDWDDDEDEDNDGTPRRPSRPSKPTRPRRDRGF
jgi:hypothetical protein